MAHHARRLPQIPLICRRMFTECTISLLALFYPGFQIEVINASIVLCAPVTFQPRSYRLKSAHYSLLSETQSGTGLYLQRTVWGLFFAAVQSEQIMQARWNF